MPTDEPPVVWIVQYCEYDSFTPVPVLAVGHDATYSIEPHEVVAA